MYLNCQVNLSYINLKNVKVTNRWCCGASRENCFIGRQSILYRLHPFSALASLVILFLHLKNSIEVMEGIEEEKKNLALPVGKLEVTYRCVTLPKAVLKVLSALLSDFKEYICLSEVSFYINLLFIS